MTYLTRVVDKACSVTRHRRIDYLVLVNAKHITTDVLQKYSSNNNTIEVHGIYITYTYYDFSDNLIRIPLYNTSNLTICQQNVVVLISDNLQGLTIPGIVYR